MKDSEWAREIRECAEPHEKREHPAFIPWVHPDGREELRALGLAQLALPDEDGALDRCLGELQEDYYAAAGGRAEAMDMTPTQVPQERRRMLATLITEVVSTAPEEEDQVEVLQSLATALLQGSRGGGSTSGIVSEEAPTLHYLYYTLTLMRAVETEKAGGVPSQGVQQLRDSQVPMAGRAKEAVHHQTARAVRRAYQGLMATVRNANG